MVDIKAVCYSHIGKRENHEDNFLFQGEWLSPQVQSEMPERKFVECHSETIAPVSLFAVSDGMGGHNGGEVASRICVEKLSGVELSACSSLEQAVELVQNKIAEINHTVCDAGKEFQSLSHMGTTLVAALTFDCQCAILNIGDSRAYFFDGDTLVQLTKDQTEGQRLLDLKLLTEEEVANFPARKHLSRYIGRTQEGLVIRAAVSHPACQGGKLLLCSDGLTDSLSVANIAHILHGSDNIAEAGRLLMEAACRDDHADNITLILISLGAMDV